MVNNANVYETFSAGQIMSLYMLQMVRDGIVRTLNILWISLLELKKFPLFR